MLYHEENLTFQILGVDRFFHKDGPIFVKARPYVALSFRESGEGEFSIGETRFVSHAGEISFVPAGVDYRAWYRQSTSLVVHLAGCHYGAAEHYPCAACGCFSSMFAKMLAEWQTFHAVNRVKAEVYTVLATLKDNACPPGDAAFLRALSYLRAHSGDPSLSVPDLSRVAGMSAAALLRRFETYLGIPPGQYLSCLRLEGAMRLLLRGEHTVREVAYLSGFSDEKYFSRAFRRHYGKPPSSFIGRK